MSCHIVLCTEIHNQPYNVFNIFAFQGITIPEYLQKKPLKINY